MSRKKFCLDRSRGFVSRDPAHFLSASLQEFCLLILISFSAYWWQCHRVCESDKRAVVECVNHGSIRGSWPMAISGYPRHLSKFVKHFLKASTMRFTEYPQRFHKVFPIASVTAACMSPKRRFYEKATLYGWLFPLQDFSDHHTVLGQCAISAKRRQGYQCFTN